MIKLHPLLIVGTLLLGLTACSTGTLPPADLTSQSAPETLPATDPLNAQVTALAEPTTTRQINAYVFEPLVGAPQTVSTDLSRQLAATAEARGVKILPPTLGEPTHKIKGYMSAVSNGAGTFVNYTWDILTPSNQRVFRVQGQALGGSSSDPWKGVGGQTIVDIATDTIDQIKEWEGR